MCSATSHGSPGQARSSGPSTGRRYRGNGLLSVWLAEHAVVVRDREELQAGIRAVFLHGTPYRSTPEMALLLSAQRMCAEDKRRQRMWNCTHGQAGPPWSVPSAPPARPHARPPPHAPPPWPIWPATHVPTHCPGTCAPASAGPRAAAGIHATAAAPARSCSPSPRAAAATPGGSPTPARPPRPRPAPPPSSPAHSSAAPTPPPRRHPHAARTGSEPMLLAHWCPSEPRHGVRPRSLDRAGAFRRAGE